MEDTHTDPVTVRRTWRTSISTKYLGPTNYRGSRIAVYRSDGGYMADPDRIRVSWDDGLDTGDNHTAAIAEYLRRKLANGNDWVTGGYWVTGGTEVGQTAVFVPTHTPDRMYRGDHSIVMEWDRPTERDDAYRSLSDVFGMDDAS